MLFFDFNADEEMIQQSVINLPGTFVDKNEHMHLLLAASNTLYCVRCLRCKHLKIFKQCFGEPKLCCKIVDTASKP